jgi:hypothetical protein
MTDALDHVDQLCAWLANTDIALLERLVELHCGQGGEDD